MRSTTRDSGASAIKNLNMFGDISARNKKIIHNTLIMVGNQIAVARIFLFKPFESLCRTDNEIAQQFYFRCSQCTVLEKGGGGGL